MLTLGSRGKSKDTAWTRDLAVDEDGYIINSVSGTRFALLTFIYRAYLKLSQEAKDCLRENGLDDKLVSLAAYRLADCARGGI